MKLHIHKEKHYTFEYGPYDNPDSKVGTLKITNTEGKSFHVMTQELLAFVCKVWVEPGMKRAEKRKVSAYADKVKAEHAEYAKDLYGILSLRR